MRKKNFSVLFFSWLRYVAKVFFLLCFCSQLYQFYWLPAVFSSGIDFVISQGDFFLNYNKIFWIIYFPFPVFCITSFVLFQFFLAPCFLRNSILGLEIVSHSIKQTTEIRTFWPKKIFYWSGITILNFCLRIQIESVVGYCMFSVRVVPCVTLLCSLNMSFINKLMPN